MRKSRLSLNESLGRIGFFFLAATLFLMSFPRFISLYTMAGFLAAGLILLILEGEGIKHHLRVDLYVLLPPLLYFLIQIVSLVLQQGDLALIEKRLMFLLIPVFGIPLFRHPYLYERASILFKFFVLGIAVISLFLIFRMIFILFTTIPAGVTFSEYFIHNNNSIVSRSFSIWEHPSYLSMKVVFAFMLLYLFSGEWKVGEVLKWSIYLLFALMIFMLASKAGIIACILLVLILLVRSARKRSIKPFYYFLIIPLLLTLTFIAVKKIERVSYFIVYTGRGLSQEDFEWKNLDQRTREWYSSLQLIKEKPLTGFGIVHTEEKLVQVYQENGFLEEAELRLNAHNQYLEAQMTFGIAGLVSLLWMLLTPLIFRRKLRLRELAFPFTVLMTFYLMFESMFNRQWGIMFFMLFYFLIVIPKKADDSSEKIST